MNKQLNDLYMYWGRTESLLLKSFTSCQKVMEEFIHVNGDKA